MINHFITKNTEHYCVKKRAIFIINLACRVELV